MVVSTSVGGVLVSVGGMVGGSTAKRERIKSGNESTGLAETH